MDKPHPVPRHRRSAPIPNGKLGETPRIGGSPKAGAATEDPTGLGAAASLQPVRLPPVGPESLSRSGRGSQAPGAGPKLVCNEEHAMRIEQLGSGPRGIALELFLFCWRRSSSSPSCLQMSSGGLGVRGVGGTGVPRGLEDGAPCAGAAQVSESQTVVEPVAAATSRSSARAEPSQRARPRKTTRHLLAKKTKGLERY